MITELRIYGRGEVVALRRHTVEGGTWSEVKARCTANTREPLEGEQVRCMRIMGHGGLHRYECNGSIIEFENFRAWFPHYSVENLR